MIAYHRGTNERAPLNVGLAVFGDTVSPGIIPLEFPSFIPVPMADIGWRDGGVR